MTDLKNKRTIYLKAFLFIAIGAISGGLLLAQSFAWPTAALLCLVIWSFCRVYYFAFYVIEHYVDPQFRFAGLFAASRYLLRRER